MFKNTTLVDVIVFYISAIFFAYSITITSNMWWLSAVVHIITMSIFSAVIHRFYCHDAFKANEWTMKTLATISCAYLFPNPVQWRIYHAYHHAYGDTPKDPHNLGFAGFFGYGHNIPAHEQRFLNNARRQMRDPYLMFLLNKQLLISLLWGGILAIIDVNLFLFAFAVPMFTIRLANRVHKELSHGKSFTTGERYATNHWWLEYICPMGGEWMHSDHHVVSNRENFNTKWYQLDTGWLLINIVRQRG